MNRKTPRTVKAVIRRSRNGIVFDIVDDVLIGRDDGVEVLKDSVYEYK